MAQKTRLMLTPAASSATLAGCTLLQSRLRMSELRLAKQEYIHTFLILLLFLVFVLHTRAHTRTHTPSNGLAKGTRVFDKPGGGQMIAQPRVYRRAAHMNARNEEANECCRSTGYTCRR